jgi:hypothetical protein
MATLPTSATVDLSCPDCGEPIAVSLDLSSVVDKPAGVAKVRVTFADSVADRFIEHVMTDPEAHPPFAARADA